MKHIHFKWILTIFFSFSLVLSFAGDTLRIAISKGIGSNSYQKYHQLIKNVDKKIITLNLYGLMVDSAKKVLKTCDGIIFSGGVDIHPSYYKSDSLAKYCEEFDSYRDSLEIGLAEEAFRLKIPILGICRGLQLLNVYLGGTLTPDIPTLRGKTVLHRINDTVCMHQLEINQNCLLFELNGNKSVAKVNSFHHQAIDKIAPLLKAVASTKDGSIEAVELKNSSTQFLLALQWHPEKLTKSMLSKRIASKFVENCKKFHHKD
ncbi:MAG: gamma-glutamyl-gamma-aminobutyrate hydrolase family protein [Bacteroidota bacterium]